MFPTHVLSKSSRYGISFQFEPLVLVVISFLGGHRSPARRICRIQDSVKSGQLLPSLVPKTAQRQIKAVKRFEPTRRFGGTNMNRRRSQSWPTILWTVMKASRWGTNTNRRALPPRPGLEDRYDDFPNEILSYRMTKLYHDIAMNKMQGKYYMS